MSSGNRRKETQFNLSKVTSPGVTRIFKGTSPGTTRIFKVTSPSVIRIFKVSSREMAEIGDASIVKIKITNQLTAKWLPLSKTRRECLATNACFNCTGTKHRADDYKTRSLCHICHRKHHTSICNSINNQLMTATSMEKQTVIYPVVVVEVLGVKCCALLDTGARSSYATCLVTYNA